MDTLKELCQAMAANPHIMKFSDIAKAAGSGAAMAQKSAQPQAPLIGAVLGVSIEASKRALVMSEELLQQYSEEDKEQKPRSRVKNA